MRKYLRRMLDLSRGSMLEDCGFCGSTISHDSTEWDDVCNHNHGIFNANGKDGEVFCPNYDFYNGFSRCWSVHCEGFRWCVVVCDDFSLREQTQHESRWCVFPLCFLLSPFLYAAYNYLSFAWWSYSQYCNDGLVKLRVSYTGYICSTRPQGFRDNA
jgi:hypothetical protein